MKKIAIFLLAAVMLLVVGCKPQDDPKPDPTPDPTPVDPTWPRPSWQVSPLADGSHSMTIIFALPDSIEQHAGLTDLAGVFSGDQCLACGTLQRTDIGYRAMMLVSGPATNMSRQLTISYYCTATQKLYVSCETVAYVADSRLGSVDEPHMFTWKYAAR